MQSEGRWSFSDKQKVHYSIEKKPTLETTWSFKNKYTLDFQFNQSYDFYHINFWESSQIHSTFVSYQLIIGITCGCSWQTSTLINSQLLCAHIWSIAYSAPCAALAPTVVRCPVHELVAQLMQHCADKIKRMEHTNRLYIDAIHFGLDAIASFWLVWGHPLDLCYPPTFVGRHPVTELPLHHHNHLPCEVPALHRMPHNWCYQHVGHVVSV